MDSYQTIPRINHVKTDCCRNGCVTAELSRLHRVNSGLDTIRESYGSAEYIHDLSELGDDNEAFPTPLLAPVEISAELPGDHPQGTGPIRSTFLKIVLSNRRTATARQQRSERRF
jgi:hypothetical protein